MSANNPAAALSAGSRHKKRNQNKEQQTRSIWKQLNSFKFKTNDEGTVNRKQSATAMKFVNCRTHSN
jgi:hypothetical protein